MICSAGCDKSMVCGLAQWCRRHLLAEVGGAATECGLEAAHNLHTAGDAPSDLLSSPDTLLLLLPGEAQYEAQ